MLNINPKPDFERFLDTLLLRKGWKRPPMFDFHVDDMHKESILGRPMKTPADDVAFWHAAGYDYVHAFYLLPTPEMKAKQDAAKKASGSRSHASMEDDNIINSLEHYRSRRWAWQEIAQGDLSALSSQFDDFERMAEALPDGMKLILHGADIFTYAWEMIGFNQTCFASYEEPEFVDAVMGDLAGAVHAGMQEGLKRLGDAVGAIFFSDDIAYTAGLMLGPDFFRQMLFPHIKTLADMGKAAGKPLIYHSDGKLYDVFDDLAQAGVRGIQPLEPKSMEPLEIQKRWPGKFCLMGNIDLDLLGRGTLDQAEAETRKKIEELGAQGGYMPGVSNTVPDYVKIENYARMIETIHSYPDDAID